jgi:hypothetical protein
MKLANPKMFPLLTLKVARKKHDLQIFIVQKQVAWSSGSQLIRTTWSFTESARAV